MPVRPIDLSDARLRALLGETPIGHADLDGDGTIRHCNAALAAMIGLPAGAVLGRSWISLLEESDRAVVAAELRRLGAGAAAHVEGEHALVHADGTTIPAYVFLGTVSAAERPARIVALVLDRSVRHAAFRAMERSERLLAAGERFAHLGSWQYDPATGESTWSAQLYRLLGAEPGFVEPTPETLLSLVHPDDQPMLARAMALDAGPETGSEATSEATSEALPDALVTDVGLRGLDGRERTLSLRIRSVRDPDGRPGKVFGTALDVTETRQLEAQLRDARDLFASVLSAATEQAIDRHRRRSAGSGSSTRAPSGSSVFRRPRRWARRSTGSSTPGRWRRSPATSASPTPSSP